MLNEDVSMQDLLDSIWDTLSFIPDYVRDPATRIVADLIDTGDTTDGGLPLSYSAAYESDAVKALLDSEVILWDSETELYYLY